MGDQQTGHGMETAVVGHGQGGPAHGAIEQAGQVQMPQIGHVGLFAKGEPEPLGTGSVRGVIARKGWHWRWFHHNVVAKVEATHAAMGTPLKGAIGNDRRRQGFFEVVAQPGFGDAGVEVIPGQGAIGQGGQVEGGWGRRDAIRGIQGGIQVRGGGIGIREEVPFPGFDAAILPGEVGFGDRLLPGSKGAIEAFPPGIHPRSQFPSAAHHGAQPAIAPSDKILHRRNPHIGEIHLHTANGAELRPQQVLLAAKFARRHRMPLERRVRLGREIGDGDIEIQAAAVGGTAFALQPAHGFRNSQHIGVGFPRQPNHEIELDFVPTLFPGGFDALEQFGVGEAFVHNVAQALGARFRGKGQPARSRPPQHIGNVFVKAIDPLTGQRQGNVFPLKPVFDFQPHGGEREIVRTAQGQERKFVVAGGAHPFNHGIHHRIGIHVPGRARQHSRLAEATAPRATAPDFDFQAIVDGFHVGHQGGGVVGHRVGDAAQDLRGYIWAVGTHRAVRLHGIKLGHIDPRHLGQIQQQGFPAQARLLALLDHQPHFRQHFFPVAEDDQIKKVGVGFWVGGGGLAAREDQRPGGEICALAIAPGQGNPRQIQHFQNVGGPEFVAEAEAKNVVVLERSPRLHRKQGRAGVPQLGR